MLASTGSNSKSQNTSKIVLRSARLDQNVPKPFNRTTIINYYIPQSAGNAIINVTGIHGKNTKTIALHGKTARFVAGDDDWILFQKLIPI
jgi:hypothetical protein